MSAALFDIALAPGHARQPQALSSQSAIVDLGKSPRPPERGALAQAGGPGAQ